MGIGLSAQGVNMNRLPGKATLKAIACVSMLTLPWSSGVLEDCLVCELSVMGHYVNVVWKTCW